MAQQFGISVVWNLNICKTLFLFIGKLSLSGYLLFMLENKILVKQ
jgi:hypothetical protein